MAKRKSSKPTSGQRIQVKDGVTMPEFPELVIGGWTGTVLETQGRGAAMKVILEWDDPILEKLPQDYREQCEAQHMLYAMACLPADDVEPTAE